MSPAVLLDTCAVIWLANGDPMAAGALAAIRYAGTHDGIFVSPISAWEIGMLARPRTGRVAALRFMPDPRTWFARFVTGPGIRTAPFDPDIAIAASFLPDGDGVSFHGDPADRLIAATARHLGMPLVTRDRRLIDYAASGGLAAVAC